MRNQSSSNRQSSNLICDVVGGERAQTKTQRGSNHVLVSAREPNSLSPLCEIVCRDSAHPAQCSVTPSLTIGNFVIWRVDSLGRLTERTRSSDKSGDFLRSQKHQQGVLFDKPEGNVPTGDQVSDSGIFIRTS